MENNFAVFLSREVNEKQDHIGALPIWGNLDDWYDHFGSDFWVESNLHSWSVGPNAGVGTLKKQSIDVFGGMLKKPSVDISLSPIRDC